MATQDFPEMMTVQETAAFLRCSVRTIYKRLQQGTMPALKNGHTWRISKSALIGKAQENMKK
jgi:excisionase family DNA binding protein